ncbi:Heterodisulfide reductase subunit C [Candidatus Hydrogenisulfobacillus filiaventi]|uniref:Heterodisulfide reductase subunit C n=1 Tax=Candidatus Hydrogenisulfobacillus filiaventi TaxID=2707344 RepID=A0A6F8ZEA0_9FIRM|nr:Heterodisulfide reductase subunit C [Candidatus Hydrogenisulfobacillus filiaventi]
MVPKGAGIHERSLVDDDQIIEFENYVMDGVDISGRWNTFIKPRVHADFETQTLDEIRRDLTGASIDRCIQCGMCTAGCTVQSEVPDFNPRAYIYWVRTGRVDELKKHADTIWRCVGCYNCTHHCPKGVNTAEVIEAIGQWLHKVVPEKMSETFRANHEAYRHHLAEHGRLNLALLQADFLRRVGRTQELFSPEMKKTAIKTMLDGRAIRTMMIGRPAKWRASRRVLLGQAGGQ